MAHDNEALGKYREGKASLNKLLSERDDLLQRLQVLIEYARDLSTSDTIVKFDAVKSQEILATIAGVETQIASLISEINGHAEKCGEVPLTVQNIDSGTNKSRS
jgi:hypothetical protein